MLERILEVIKKENLNHSSYADEIGIQRSSLSHILNGRNNPSLDFVIKTLQRFPNINPEWLILGKGMMYKSFEEDEKEIEPVSISQDLFSTINQKSLEEKKVSLPEEAPEIPVNEDIIEEKTVRYVSQVLIFYSDSTYQVYKPEKPA